MKKIINNPGDVVPEMVSGLVRSYPELVKRLPGTQVVARNDNNQKEGIVGLVSGGGSGHEPAHAGFVGDGMLNAAVCGQVFTSPTPDQIFEAIKESDQGKGVFLVIKNYSGDVMNFDMAKDLAEMEDIKVDYVVVDDDIAIEDSTYTQGKRGVAGTVLVHKILGSMARSGASLSEIKAAADELVKNIKTIGIALAAATVPEVGKPGFVLEDDEIEFGVGIHGEPGYKREKIGPSKVLAKELVNQLKKNFGWSRGDEYGILVNGMGSTPLMEQFIMMNDVLDLFADEGITIRFSKVGNYMTSLDMLGLSVSMIKLVDSDWEGALKEPVKTISWG